MNDETVSEIPLIAHECEIERKTRIIRRLIAGWMVTVGIMAALIGVIHYG